MKLTSINQVRQYCEQQVKEGEAIVYESEHNSDCLLEKGMIKAYCSIISLLQPPEEEVVKKQEEIEVPIDEEIRVFAKAASAGIGIYSKGIIRGAKWMREQIKHKLKNR